MRSNLDNGLPKESSVTSQVLHEILHLPHLRPPQFDPLSSLRHRVSLTKHVQASGRLYSPVENR